MAKISQFPSLAVISGFKGVLDYYLHGGVACVRSWPKSPGHRRAPAVEAQWATFSYAAHFWSYLTPEIQAQYIAMAENGGLTGRDLAMRAYMSGLFTYPTGGIG